MIRAIQDLPDDATVMDAIERLLFLREIEEGLEQSRRGDVVAQREVEAGMRSSPVL